MKLKRRRLPPDEQSAQPQSFRTVRGPYKGHATHDYESSPKPRKEQRARRKRQLREKYGLRPDTPRPTDEMSHEQRRALRQEVLQAANGRCQRCGSRFRLTLDHIVPRHLGGGNHRENLQCLCETCNRAKGLDIWAAGDGTQPAPFFCE